LTGSLKGRFWPEILSLLEKPGEVRGQINVKTFIVSRKVTGNVTANNRIEIQSSGEVLGDVQTPVLVISEGGVLEGNCKMVKAETEPEEKVSFLKPREDAFSWATTAQSSRKIAKSGFEGTKINFFLHPGGLMPCDRNMRLVQLP
jgi:cytoskeletal protein CcmA (bactofilin family)